MTTPLKNHYDTPAGIPARQVAQAKKSIKLDVIRGLRHDGSRVDTVTVDTGIRLIPTMIDATFKQGRWRGACPDAVRSLCAGFVLTWPRVIVEIESNITTEKEIWSIIIPKMTPPVEGSYFRGYILAEWYGESTK